MTDVNATTTPVEVKKLKLDLGCGPKKPGPDWTGVDIRPFNGLVDVVCDLAEPIDVNDPNACVIAGLDRKPVAFKKWQWDDNSVDEAFSSHFVEHLYPAERIHFVNELCRVMKVGTQARIIAPHWCSTRAYGDLSHVFPPVSEMWWFYLTKAWRDQEAPHSDYYTCNFTCNYGYAMRQDLINRNQEYQQFALSNWKETAQDIIATLVKL